MKNVVLAEKSGFCFGVTRAVNMALKLKEDYKDRRIYTLGPLIHNNEAVEFLKKRDIYSIELNDIDELTIGDVIIIRSHGVPKSVVCELENRGLIVHDATCPYVSNIHKRVNEFYNKGYEIVIVGDEEHPEVIGINGWCDNSAIISKDGSNLNKRFKRVCVVSQTTEKQSNWEKVLNTIVSLSKEIVAINTICDATGIRQKNAEKLSREVDAMVVIGGYNSSNTTKLYEICKKNCAKTFHIENTKGIPLEILKDSNVKKIGVTAGASTPEWIIKEAINKMEDLRNVKNEEAANYDMYLASNSVYVGALLEGEVFKINDTVAYLTIGSKSEAILPITEFACEDGECTSLKEKLTIGQKITAKVINRKNDDGFVVLSTTEIARQQNLEELQNIFDEGRIIKVTITEVVKGGVIARFKGIRVFIPASHIDINRVKDLSKFVGQEVEVKIIEMERKRNNLKVVGSRREILKAQKDAKESATWEQLEKDQVVDGIVRRISNFGAFVEINGVDGLLHNSEISFNKYCNPHEYLKVGDTVKVYILDIDKENKKMSLSLKKLMENPWDNISEKYPVANVVLGKVVRFTKFGAFVQLEDGVDGLVHISQISKERIEKPEDVLKIGESVKALILEVNGEEKRISLSIKAAE